MAASINQVPNTFQLLYVKEHVGVKWKDLARMLEFLESTIDVFEAKHKDPRDSCMEMLASWQRRTGLDGTTEVLKEALENAKLKDIADHLTDDELISRDNQQLPTGAAAAPFSWSRLNFVGNGLGLESDKKLRTLFVRVSKKIGSDWKDLARVLVLSEVDIKTIEDNNPGNLKDQAYQSLLLWQHQAGLHATIDALNTALQDCELEHLATPSSSTSPTLSRRAGEGESWQIPELVVKVELGIVTKEDAQQLMRRVIEVEEKVFTPEVLSDPERMKQTLSVFKEYKASVLSIHTGCFVLRLTFLQIKNVDEFYHDHYRMGEGTLSDKLSRILIPGDLQAQVGGAQLIVRLHVKHEDYLQVRRRLGTGLKRTMSVDNLATMLTPTKHHHNNDKIQVCSLDLASTTVENAQLSDWATNPWTLNLVKITKRTSKRVRQLESKLETRKHQATLQETMVLSLQREVKRLRETEETAQKVLFEQKEENVQMQAAKKAMDAENTNLVKINEKLASKIALLEGTEKETASEESMSDTVQHAAAGKKVEDMTELSKLRTTHKMDLAMGEARREETDSELMPEQEVTSLSSSEVQSVREIKTQQSSFSKAVSYTAPGRATELEMEKDPEVKAVALLDRTTELEAGDLVLRRGDIVTIKDRTTADVWAGELNGKFGNIPASVVKPLPSGLQVFETEQISLMNRLNGTTNDRHAVVKRAELRWRKGGASMVAVKMYKEKEQDTQVKITMEDILQEMELLASVQPHPNIMHLLGTCVVEGRISLVSEFCEVGDLRDWIRDHRTCSPEEILRFCIDISRGMGHLEMKEISHCWLVPDNVLLDGKLQAKLGGFYQAKPLLEGVCKPKMTPKHFSPPEWPRTRTWTMKADVWSFGTSMWQLFEKGENPGKWLGWTEDVVHEKLSTGYQLPLPEGCPPQIYAVMQRCWAMSAEDRPTFLQLSRELESLRDTFLQATAVKALVLYDRTTELEAGDLVLRRGDIVTIKDRTTADVWTGELNGKFGNVPAFFVRVLPTGLKLYKLEQLQQLEEVSSAQHAVLRKTLIDENTTAVIKIFKDASKLGTAGEVTTEDAMEEVEMLFSLQTHPNVVQLLGACVVQGVISPVLEFCEQGDLCAWVKGHPACPPDQLLKFCLDISRGMGHIEAKQVAHCWLVPENILLDRNLQAKIGGFHQTRALQRGVCKPKASPIQFAPREFFIQRIWTAKADIWSFGVTMWKVFNKGEDPVPYLGSTQKDVVKTLSSGYRLPCPTQCPPEIYAIMMKCWAESPLERPTFVELERQIKCMDQERQTV